MSNESVTYISLVGPALGVIILAIAGAVQGKRKKPETETAEVVAATFTERALMEQLILALRAVNASLADTNRGNERLVELLEQDAQRRRVEADVRAALKERGIVT